MEIYYKGTCRRVAEKLRQARELCPNFSFQMYLDAKVSELLLGTEESRRISDALWIAHDYRVDLLLSTAMEVYMDEWKNIKGAPTGGVFIKNKSLDHFVTDLLAHSAAIEREGPSPYFRPDARSSTTLILRPVDIFSWSADYCTAPQVTLAQCLPNDEEMRKRCGAVNLLYLNTTTSLLETSQYRSHRTFLPRAEFERLKGLFSEASSISSMLHELGHTTGQAADPARRTENPELTFGNEYNCLEELRAEVFSMYGVCYCEEHRIITSEMARASHYDMLSVLVGSLKHTPVQAHQKARNMMFHFFKKRGGIVELKEEAEVVQPDGSSKTEDVVKWAFDLEKLKPLVLEFLGRIQDIKSRLDKDGLLHFFCFL